jgi:hypothetical protein
LRFAAGLAPPEQGIEVVIKLWKAAGEAIGWSASAIGLAPFPGLAPAGIAEDRVGSIHRLEALLSHGVVAVEIRVPEASLLAEGTLQAGGVGTGLQAQHGPEIGALGRVIQHGP